MNINYDTMKQICLAQIEDFAPLGKVTNTEDGVYIYKDNHSPILGVAHLDSVLDLNHFHVVNIKGDDLVLNAQLDDRLGVYTLLDLLPQLGVKFDLLLTEGEESGRSTAAHFKANKSYNWIFSFDRRGEGVVLYQFHGKQWEGALKHSGFKIEQGSFSDIAFLDELGVKAVNVGTGYHGEHSEMCYANMTELKRQAGKFANFYHTNKGIKYPHTYDKRGFWGRIFPSNNYAPAYTRGTDYDNLMCELCGGRTGTVQIIESIWVCKQCFNDAELCQDCEGLFYNYELMNGLCPDCLMDAEGED